MGGANYSQMPPGSFISGQCLRRRWHCSSCKAPKCVLNMTVRKEKKSFVSRKCSLWTYERQTGELLSDNRTSRGIRASVIIAQKKKLVWSVWHLASWWLLLRFMLLCGGVLPLAQELILITARDLRMFKDKAAPQRQFKGSLESFCALNLYLKWP